MRFREGYHFYDSITIGSWSLSYVLIRLALNCFSVYALDFLRYLIATLTLVGVAVVLR